MTSATVDPTAPTSIFERRAGDTEPARRIPLRLLRTMASASVSYVENGRPVEALRHAALRLDGAGRALRETDADRALLLWEGLVCGRLTLVDWFDANGRRFILVKLAEQEPGCTCGLTAREYEVAMAATLGESSKITAYRLGISPSRVSTLLRATMRKLGVRTKAQLVIMVRLLENQQQKAQHGADRDHALRKEGGHP